VFPRELKDGMPAANMERRSIPPAFGDDYESATPGITAAGGVQRHPRFRYAEVDAHHNVMLINPESLTSALIALG
jgi:hypothetical protein